MKTNTLHQICQIISSVEISQSLFYAATILAA